MTSAPLTVHQISKSYTSTKVLDAVDFALQPGEIFGLIGLNGAGKTTLIKIILDLVRPQQGEALIFGLPASNIQARKNISYLPEKFQPSRYLKGFEYLDLSRAYYGQTLDRERARELASALDLNPDVLTERVGSYSKGMGQKLGLVGAFLLDTPFLILDEPMSGLDPSARIHLKAQLLKAKQQGKTIFFSSHILSDIDEICDRIGVLHHTRLQFIGNPKEFKSAQGQASLEQAFLQSIAA